jgi:mevalonate kinase
LHNKIFNSKLLLLGEYTVINGGQALAIPLNKYNGSWENAPSDISSREGLLKLLNYVKGEGTLTSLFDIKQFEDDISAGLSFVSNIPLGYGLGSSGALVAAFYHRYVFSAASDMHTLKSTLATLENAYHGASSGLDPLVCYLNKPIWLNGPHMPIQVLDSEIDTVGMFLYDTKSSRHTETLVNQWKQRNATNPSFVEANKHLGALNVLGIEALLARDMIGFYYIYEQISTLQMDWYAEMIPADLVQSWQGKDYCLKLCGAGGGGMMLGLSRGDHKSVHLPGIVWLST